MARIAIVHDVAGVGSVQVELLRGAGHDVDHVGLPMMGAGWPWPQKAIGVAIRLAMTIPVAIRLRRRRYDAVLIHWISQGVLGLVLGRPFAVQAHGSDLHLNFKNRFLRSASEMVLERAEAIFYVTPNLGRFLARHGSKAHQLPNPVELPPAVPPPASRSVIAFTRLDPVKGVDISFPALREVAEFATVTALAWGPLTAQYQAIYGDVLDFIPTFAHSEVADRLQRFDVVVGQMQQGILSLAEIEALAAGRPLVTGLDVSFYPEDVPPVVVARTADEIVSVVRSLLDDPDRCRRLGDAGRAWVTRNHSPSQHVAILEAVLRLPVSRGAGGPA